MNAYTPRIYSRAITEQVLNRPAWDRDPASHSFRCWGCDEYRPTETAYCDSCDATTGSYVDDGEVIPYVDIVTARCVDRDERLFRILTADRPLTSEEQAYVDAAEARAA